MIEEKKKERKSSISTRYHNEFNDYLYDTYYGIDWFSRHHLDYNRLMQKKSCF